MRNGNGLRAASTLRGDAAKFFLIFFFRRCILDNGNAGYIPVAS